MNSSKGWTVSFARVAVAVLVFAFVAPGRAQTIKDVAAEMNLLRKETDELLGIRDGIARQLTVPADGGINGLYEITLPSAMAEVYGGRDLTFQILCRNGKLTRGLAAFKIFPPGVSVDLRKLEVTKDGLKGEASFTVAMVFSLGARRFDEAPAALRYSIDMVTSGPKFRGRARLLSPRYSATYTLATDCVAEGAFHPLTTPVFAPPGKGAERMDDLIGDARGYEALAALAYEQIRAMEITRLTGLPFEHALLQVTSYRVQRQTLVEKKSVKKESSGPSVDDMGGEIDGGAAAAPAVDTASSLAIVKDMRRYVARITKVVRDFQVSSGKEAADYQLGSAETGDPDFGHWFGRDPLPTERGLTNIVVGAPGGAGPQKWQYVSNWAVTGPFFSPGQWAVETPFLPDVVPDFGAPCALGDFAKRNNAPGQIAQWWTIGYVGKNPSPWSTVKVDPGTGGFQPPPWHGGDKWAMNEGRYGVGPGLDGSSFAAFAVIDAEEGGDFWMGATVNDSAALWIDNRLVWSSGFHETQNSAQTCLFRARLSKGRNSLMLRGDDRQHPSYFALWICTQGAPRPTAVAKAAVEKRQAAIADMKPEPNVRGFRGDGAGRFPGARPVTAWDVEKMINVLWRTPLWTGNGSPVIAGDRMLVTEDPFYLVCLDRNTGKLLWRRDLDPLEFINRAAYEEAKGLRADVEEQYGKYRSMRSEMEAHGVSIGISGEWKGADVAGAKKALVDAQGKLAQRIVSKGGPMLKFGGDVAGSAFSTPVTDGARVWAKFGCGPVACFNLDGNRLWCADTKIASGESTPSLVLAGGKVVGQFGETLAAGVADDDDGETPDEKKLRPEQGAKTAQNSLTLIAWDAMTGREAWRTQIPPSGKWRAGSPVTTRLADGAGAAMDIVLTPGGVVARVDDGVLLLKDIDWQRGCRKDFDTPTVVGDVVYYTRFLARDAPGPTCAEMVAYRLIMENRDSVGAKPLWRTLQAGDLCTGWSFDGKRLYAFGGDLWIVDAQSGKPNPCLGNIHVFGLSNAWTPVCVGDGILVVADSWRGLPPLNPLGVSFVRPDPYPRVISRNLNENMIAHPTLEGDRLYLRAQSAVICVGYTGDEGRRYEAEINARTVLSGIQRRRPDDSEVLDIKPSSSSVPAMIDWTVQCFVPGRVLHVWDVAGPFPREARDASRKAIGHPGWAVKCGQEVAVNGTKITVTREPNTENIPVIGRCGTEIDLLKKDGTNGNCVVYWHAKLAVPVPVVARFEMGALPGVTAWLSGKQVSDSQRLRLASGGYDLVIEAEVEQPRSEVMVAPRFWVSDDPAQELATWLAAVNADRDLVERALKLSPDSEVGKACAEILKDAGM